MSLIIKKIIYYCWFGGEKPQKVLDCINNWKEKLPDYEIIEINEYDKELFDVEKECHYSLWFKTVWENKMWAYVSDYARLKVLFERGGVYFDTDITVEKDITELLEENKLVLGWEDAKKINAAVIITPAKNNDINRFLQFYYNNIFHSNLYTIPDIVTEILNKNYTLNDSNSITDYETILVLPPEYFYPMPFGEKNKDAYKSRNTYTVHWWDASWFKSNYEYFLKNKHKYELNKLIKKCFFKNVIFENKFFKIETLFKRVNVVFDFYFLLRFKYAVINSKTYLTVYILGFQIIIWRVK